MVVKNLLVFFITLILSSLFVSSSGYHYANEIFPGSFQNGNFSFNGSVGVGTNIPAAFLHVKGAVGGKRSLLLEANDGSGVWIEFNNTDSRWQIGQRNTEDFAFWQDTYGGIYPLVIQNGTGNIGIDSEDPDAKLEIGGFLYNQSVDLISIKRLDGGIPFRLRYNGTSSPYEVVFEGNNKYFTFANKLGYEESFVISPDGNIGVGTKTPHAKFTINQSNSGCWDCGIELEYGNGNSWQIVADSTNGERLHFGYNHGSNFVLVNGSHVGIGTYFPNKDSRLNIIGTGTSSYRGILVQNSEESNVNRGAISIMGARKDLSLEPFSVLGSWDNGIERAVYLGGGGWGVPDATSVRIFVDDYVETTGTGVNIANFDILGLHVTGDVDASGCVTAGGSTLGGSCVSDENLKTNIISLNDSLSKINSLRPVKFLWNSSFYNISRQNGTSIGFIAQEFEKVFPEKVKLGEDGYKRITFDSELLVYTIQAIKDQQKIIDDQDKKIIELESRISLIESKLNLSN